MGLKAFLTDFVHKASHRERINKMKKLKPVLVLVLVRLIRLYEWWLIELGVALPEPESSSSRLA